MNLLTRRTKKSALPFAILLGAFIFMCTALKKMNSGKKKLQKRAQELEDSLLKLSKAHKKTPHFPAYSDLNRIISEVISELEDHVQKSRAKIIVASKIPLVYANPQRMHQLFLNVLSNALKFQKKGLPPSIVIHTETLEGFVRIMVQDNGIGIPSKYVEKIFTGIGLALCKKIVESHKGRIYAESSEGLGTILIIDLPANDESEGAPL